METKKISMDIPVDMYDWLCEHNINRTQLFRKAVDEIRFRKKNKKKNISSLYFLISMMGIMFALISIIVGSTVSFFHLYTRIFLITIGALMLLLISILLGIKRKSDK